MKSQKDLYCNYLLAISEGVVSFEHLASCQRQAKRKYPFDTVLQETLANGIPIYKYVFGDGSEILNAQSGGSPREE